VLNIYWADWKEGIVKDIYEDSEARLVSMKAGKFFTVFVSVKCPRKCCSTEFVSEETLVIFII
jgi:hypothetical protein